MKKESFILILMSCFSVYPQSTTRYIDSEFNYTQTHTNQIYVTAPQLNSPYLGENSTSNINLTMHIFQPEGDQLQERPMLVCFHGGGFVSGNKEHDDMMEFCKIFAQKGYVTATAQYRLGMNLLSNTSGERSVYRAIQDSRALLRYLRENAPTLKISPDHIYLIGSSAGAFIGIHNLYMNKESERPAGTYAINNFPPTLDNGPDLGTLDATGSYTSHNSQANGVIALWGAIKHPDLIESNDPQIPILLVHGTADAIVPFALGSPFQLPSLSATYGSQLIDQRLTQLSYPHETYFVDGEGHEFYGVTNGNWNPAPNQYWNIVVEKVRDFLYNIHKPVAAFTYIKDEYGHVTFTNNSTNAIEWNWDFGDGGASNEQNPVHKYMQTGTYTVTLTAYSEVYSAHVVSTVIDIPLIIGVEDETAFPDEFVLYQNYPNPFNAQTQIKFSIPNRSHVRVVIYDMLGQIVDVLMNEEKQSGSYNITWNNKTAPSGVYVCKVNVVNSSAGYNKSIKMIMNK